MIDFTGTDRITQTLRDAVYVDSLNVVRTRTYAWQTNSSAVSNLISEARVLTNGLRSWNIQFGLTNQSWTAYSGGHRYVTNTAPDGSYTLGDYQGGRLLSATRRTPAAAQLGASTNGYDPHGRLSLITDARTGTTTNSFDNADRVTGVSTPAPASGQAPQVTTTTYNNMGWATSVVQPDGASVSTVYHLTGEQATNSGARAYPVAYTYDDAGRLKTMTTWTNFASAAGAAVTTWNYDSQRGWLTGKVYADSQGPAYTYTPAARLSTRAWARGVTTTYGYNAAGDLATTVYSDTTPGVTNTFDRRGRTIQTLVGTSSTSSVIFNDAGLLLSESFTAGPLSGITLTNQFDHLLRRTNVAIFNSQFSILNSASSYDVASRLSSVTFGTNSATYAYLTNSALVDTLTFKSGATTRMTTSNRFDNLNRRTSIASVGTGSTPSVTSFSYAYNAANQRTAITNAGGASSASPTYWLYQYDSLGQVTSGKRYWSDGNVVAGQQFEYGFDDIGNRKFAASGGDEWGANLRYENYSANSLNQYTQRTVPPYVNVLGAATNFATVTVNLQPTYRKGEYFRAELSADNSTAPLWFGITNVAVLTNGTGPNIVSTNHGNLLVAKATEAFLHDLDGNQTSDSLWTNIWNAENRLIATESASGVPSAGKAKETWTHLPDGRWIERVIYSWNGSAYVAQTTNRFVWDGQVLLAIVNHTNGLVTSFARGLDLSGSIQGAGGAGGVLAVNIVTNGVHFAAFDGNGNLSALVSTTNGAVTATYEYSPFGETLRANGVIAKANPIRFSTQFADDVTGDLKYLFRETRPSWGRWLSRDPIGEASFQGAFIRSVSPVGAAGLSAFVVSLVERSLVEGAYAFTRNETVSSVDYLGLLPTGQATRTIADCAIEIYAGHGYLNSAFDDDGKLKNPSAVNRLKYPHILKGTKCSGGTIIACNAAKYATVENGIPGVSLDDSQINVAQGINAIASAVQNSKSYAETLCKSCSSCKEVTINVNCLPPFSTPGFFTPGSSLCGQTIKVPCKCNEEKKEGK